MASTTTELPPLRLSRHKRYCPVSAGCPIPELLVQRWQREEGQGEPVGPRRVCEGKDCSGCGGGTSRVAGSRRQDQEVKLFLLWAMLTLEPSWVLFIICVWVTSIVLLRAI